MPVSINTNYPCHITNYAKCTSRTISYIVIHYVGAEGSSLENAKYFMNNKNLQASAHYFVGNASENGQIYLSVNDLNRAYHCGTEGTYYHKYCRNANAIGIEMCCHKDKNGKWYFDDITVNKTIELTIFLMKKYNIPIENVLRHYDCTHKLCPAPFVENPAKWDDFKNKVKEGLIDMAILDWQKEAGLEAIKYLSDGKGIDLIDSPDSWKDRLNDNTQNWLMFVMLKRIVEKMDESKK